MISFLVEPGFAFVRFCVILLTLFELPTVNAEKFARFCVSVAAAVAVSVMVISSITSVSSGCTLLVVAASFKRLTALAVAVVFSSLAVTMVVVVVATAATAVVAITAVPARTAEAVLFTCLVAKILIFSNVHICVFRLFIDILFAKCLDTTMKKYVSTFYTKQILDTE